MTTHRGVGHAVTLHRGTAHGAHKHRRPIPTAVTAGSLAVVLVVLVGIGAILVFRARSDQQPVTPGPVAPSKQQTTGVLEPGQIVESDVRRSGDLEVRHSITGAEPFETITVRADQADGQPGTRPARDVEASVSGRVVATLPSVRRAGTPIPFDDPVREVLLTYRVGAVLEDTGTVPGRALARVTTLNVDFGAESGPVRRQVRAPGEVLNVACLRTDRSPPRPCGAAVPGGWEVELEGDDRDDGLLVQIQLP